jgi:hypothetical protein
MILRLRRTTSRPRRTRPRRRRGRAERRRDCLQRGQRDLLSSGRITRRSRGSNPAPATTLVARLRTGERRTGGEAAGGVPLKGRPAPPLAQRAQVTLDYVAPTVKNVRDLANRPAFLAQPPDTRSSPRHLAFSSAQVRHGTVLEQDAQDERSLRSITRYKSADCRAFADRRNPVGRSGRFPPNVPAVWSRRVGPGRILTTRSSSATCIGISWRPGVARRKISAACFIPSRSRLTPGIGGLCSTKSSAM